MKPRTIGSLVVGAFAVVFAAVLVLFRPVAVEMAYPFERLANGFSRRVARPLVALFGRIGTFSENERLRREVESLTMVCGDMERLEAENARLRRALDYRSRTHGEWIAAAILSRGGGAAGGVKAMRVDRGTFDGIRVGAVVAVPDGLVGIVGSVTPHTAGITLITDPSVMAACQVEGTDGVLRRGITAGGDDVLVIRHLTNAEGAVPRSRVLTSGRGGVFPPGIEIGTLQEIREDGRGLLREGTVVPGVNFEVLEDVFIRCEK